MLSACCPFQSNCASPCLQQRKQSCLTHPWFQGKGGPLRPIWQGSVHVCLLMVATGLCRRTPGCEWPKQGPVGGEARTSLLPPVLPLCLGQRPEGNAGRSPEGRGLASALLPWDPLSSLPNPRWLSRRRTLEGWPEGQERQPEGPGAAWQAEQSPFPCQLGADSLRAPPLFPDPIRAQGVAWLPGGGPARVQPHGLPVGPAGRAQALQGSSFASSRRESARGPGLGKEVGGRGALAAGHTPHLSSSVTCWGALWRAGWSASLGSTACSCPLPLGLFLQVVDLTTELSDERLKGDVACQVLEAERAERLRGAREIQELQVCVCLGGEGGLLDSLRL